MSNYVTALNDVRQDSFYTNSVGLYPQFENIPVELIEHPEVYVGSQFDTKRRVLEEMLLIARKQGPQFSMKTQDIATRSGCVSSAAYKALVFWRERGLFVWYSKPNTPNNYHINPLALDESWLLKVGRTLRKITMLCATLLVMSSLADTQSNLQTGSKNLYNRVKGIYINKKTNNVVRRQRLPAGLELLTESDREWWDAIGTSRVIHLDRLTTLGIITLKAFPAEAIEYTDRCFGWRDKPLKDPYNWLIAMALSWCKRWQQTPDWKTVMQLKKRYGVAYKGVMERVISDGSLMEELFGKEKPVKDLDGKLVITKIKTQTARYGGQQPKEAAPYRPRSDDIPINYNDNPERRALEEAKRERIANRQLPDKIQDNFGHQILMEIGRGGPEKLVGDMAQGLITALSKQYGIDKDELTRTYQYISSKSE
jgi:hypothetical protein